MNFFVSLETDIWVESEKKSVVLENYIYFKQTTRVEWIEANCALKIIIFRYFAFFLEINFSFFIIYSFYIFFAHGLF